MKEVPSNPETCPMKRADNGPRPVVYYILSSDVSRLIKNAFSGQVMIFTVFIDLRPDVEVIEGS